MSHHRRPSAEEAAHLQYETEHTSPRGKSVIPYMLLLIAAAFLLLLMALLMQQRTNQSAETRSARSLHTIDELVDDNRSLHEEVARLQKELDNADGHNKALEAQLAQLKQELNQAREQLAEFITPDQR